MSREHERTDWERFLLYLHEYDQSNEKRDPDAFYQHVVDETRIYNTSDAKAAHEYLAARGLTKPPGTTAGVLTADGVHTATLLATRTTAQQTRQRLEVSLQGTILFLGLIIGLLGGIFTRVGAPLVVALPSLFMGVVIAAVGIIAIRQFT